MCCCLIILDFLAFKKISFKLFAFAIIATNTLIITITTTTTAVTIKRFERVSADAVTIPIVIVTKIIIKNFNFIILQTKVLLGLLR